MYTRDDIIKQLNAIGPPRDRVVIMHSAYSKVGNIYGGPEAFLDIMVEYFTVHGGLFCIPTHTWDLVDRTDVTLDLGKKYTNLGLLPRLALDREDGIRSENPTHSLVVFGERERALSFIENEARVETPTSPKGCYGKLYSEGGSVLLVGVDHSANTYLHAVDEMLGIPRLESYPRKLAVRYADGREDKRDIYMFDESEGDFSHYFNKYYDCFCESGAQRSGKIGDADALLCDAASIKDTLEQIYRRYEGRDPLKESRIIL